MPECIQTFDGKHHWAPRHHSYGETWECVCTQPAPSKMIRKLERMLAKAERAIYGSGEEQGEQGRLNL